MKELIKFLIHGLGKIVLKKVFKIQLGPNSIIKKNFKIEGGKYICIGSNTVIAENSWLAAYDSYLGEYYMPSIKIGKNVTIGRFSCITSIQSISIMDGCLISEYFYVSDHTHGFNPLLNISPALQKLEAKGPVEIGECTFIGYRVTVLPNVKIGRNCVIGSHSVVTKNVPDYCMVAGVPAKIIKKFDFDLNQWMVVND
ncbi:MAG: acyltransferase [Cytophagaceae bacterium]